MTLHRPSNVDKDACLQQLVTAIIDVADRLPGILPIHSRTRNKLENVGLLDTLQNNDKIFLMDPIGYINFMHLQQHAVIVLIDSDGIQEESTFFGVPCLTVRDNTERPITTTLGTNKHIGIDYRRMPQEVDLVLAANSVEHTVPDLWDGKAANRISTIIDNYFNNIL
jgi:UDP-N-acetylglucosamine 2-epimerase (non-hydrolysing)